MKDDTKKHDKKTEGAEELKKKIEELEEKLNEYENNWKRAVADYRNLEKRAVEERSETIRFANRDLLLHLLPAFDTLFLAEKHIQDEGLRLTVKRLSDVFSQVGVQRIETVEKTFDPNTMECVDVAEGEDNIVLEELGPGFTLFGKVLLPARVRVGKGK